MSGPPYVFMVPGFLGFVDLGRFEYFRRVGERLQASASLGPEPTIVRVEIHPCASLRERATQLATAIHTHAGDDDRPIHLVAHSTGGLDSRLLLTPGASLPVDFDLESIASRVRSLVTVATPHHGTPLASFFDGLAAQRLLRLGSQGAATALRATQLPVELAERLLGLLSRMTRGGSPQLALAPAGGELLDALPEDERGPLRRMLERMGEDQALVPQLAPEGIELFNASTNDRPGVRYGCVVARSPRPGLSNVIQAGVHPGSQTSSALYTVIHQIAARTPATRSRAFDAARWREVSAAFEHSVDWTDSDGVVPTLSQVWGELVHTAAGDHLDVVGHFTDDQRPPEHRDVLVSGSTFGRAQFDAMWRDVAEFMRGADPRALPPGGWTSKPRTVVARPRTTTVPMRAGTDRPATFEDRPRRALKTAVRIGGIALTFAAYEGWLWLVGDLLFARFAGFALCGVVLWLLFARTTSTEPPAPALPEG
ncbi:MAG: hypothetical protein AAF799_28550 [Myxococcota bacterium]